MVELIVTLVIGCLTGWLAGKIFSGSGNGLILNIIIGLVGSWVGNFTFNKLLPNGTICHFVGSVLGAILVLWIVSLIKGKK